MEGKVVDWNIYIYMCVCVREREREREREMFVQLIIVIYREGEKKKNSLNNHKTIIAHLTVSELTTYWKRKCMVYNVKFGIQTVEKNLWINTIPLSPL